MRYLNFRPIRGLVIATFAACSLSAQAGLDTLYASSVSLTADGVPKNVSTTVNPGNVANGTVASTLLPGSSLAFTIQFSIQNNSSEPGNVTSYSTQKVGPYLFSVNVKPPGAPDPAATFSSVSCSATSAASTCTTVLSFAAPAADGGYSVNVKSNMPGGPGHLQNKDLNLNFTVETPVVAKRATQLTTAPVCTYLNATNVQLSARLNELLEPKAPIANAEVEFYVEPMLIDGVPSTLADGSAITDAFGDAKVSFNTTGLPVGDYMLYNAYKGDAQYEASNDSDTMGISYVFGGFRQPINSDGTSIFGGRTIPIKIKLMDAAGVVVTDAKPAVWLQLTDGVNGLGEEFESTSTSAADTGNIMRYSSTDQQYIYNWDTANLANGTYKVRVNLGDSDACNSGASGREVFITLAKKGKK